MTIELTVEELAKLRVCSGCVGERFLSTEIRSRGDEGVCSYCKDDSRTFSIDELADEILIAFRDHYYLSSIEPLDQIFDRLETLEWKRRLVRIYGLRVDEKNRNTFIDTWLKVNVSIGAKVEGARGGLLLNDRGDRSIFYEVVRWDSVDAWNRFIAAPPADPEAFQKIFSYDCDLRREF